MAGRVGRPLKAETLARLGGQNIEVNPNAKINPITQKEKGLYKCTCCGKEYKSQNGHFPVTNSILYANNNGHLTICRTCVDQLYLKLIEFYSGNEEHALEHCCRIFDWYYSPEIAATTTDSSNGYSRVSMYPARMNMFQFKKRGTTYNDTIKERSLNDGKIKDSKFLEQIQKDDIKESLEIDKETVDFWGGINTYTIDEIRFLQREYEDWIAKNECKTKTQMELMKMLSIAQLGVRRAEKSGNTKSTAEAMKAFQDLLGSANLKPTQVDASLMDSQQSFGSWIKKLENERPVSASLLDEYEDKKMAKYLRTWFSGHLAKALGGRNPDEEEYDDELSKYTVNPPSNGDDNE